MKRFVLGFLAGLVVGGGGLYLFQLRPWERGETVDADAITDAGTRAKPRHHRRRSRTRPGGRGRTDEPLEEPIPQLTDRDRRLAWRGPAVELPPRRVSFAGGAETRPLTDQEINDGIRSNAAAVSACIKEARGSAPLTATVTLEFLVDGRGRPTTIRVQAPQYLLDHELLSCAQRAVRGMRFPATGAATVVKVPFDLRG